LFVEPDRTLLPFHSLPFPFPFSSIIRINLSGGSSSWCSASSSWVRTSGSVAHEGSADERNTNHEHPTWDNSENPEKVTERHSEAVLGENAVEWVEVALVKRLRLPFLGGVKIRERLDSSGGSVQRLNANIDWRRWRRELHDPERWWAGTPGIAEDRLVVAVEVSELRGSRVGRPEGCSLIESSLYANAVAKAGLVSSSNENPPLLRSRACGLDA